MSVVTSYRIEYIIACTLEQVDLTSVGPEYKTGEASSDTIA